MCSSCHRIEDITIPHWITNAECSDCHETTRWTNLTNYNHISTNFPGLHKSSVKCINCHRQDGSAFVPASRWSDPIYKPYCAGCHAGDFWATNSKHLSDMAGVKSVEANKGCGDLGCHRVSAGGW